MDQRSTILMLRIAACVVIAAALGAFIGQLKALADLTDFAVLTPLAVLAFGVGLGAILLGIGAVLQQQQKPAGASPADLAQRQLIDLALKMEDLGASMSRVARLCEGAGAAPSQTPPTGESAGNMHDELRAMQTLLEELRDMSLLPDEQRQKRWQELQQKRRDVAIQSARELIHSRRWSDAQRTIAEIENLWPGDAATAAVRNELEAGQTTTENEAFALAESQIRSEMSVAHWEEALTLARKLAGDFPANGRAAQLLNLIEKEKGIYTETTVGRLYDEIRRDVERRIWRRALMHARQLLESFPDHPRSELLRKQIHTMQDNAEIEERQERETRIGELIRTRRFREAVELSEDLLRSYPASPQAEAIQKLLPRVLELAAQEESNSPPTSLVAAKVEVQFRQT